MIKYRTKLIEKNQHGKSTSHLLKTTESVIEPPVINCIGGYKINTRPLFENNGTNYNSDGMSSDMYQKKRYFTYSRNDGPIQRVLIDSEGVTNDAGWLALDMMMAKLDTDLCRAQDGVSLAFCIEDCNISSYNQTIPEINSVNNVQGMLPPIALASFQVDELSNEWDSNEVPVVDYTYAITGISGDGSFPYAGRYLANARNIAIPHPLSSLLSLGEEAYFDEYPRWYPENTIQDENNKLTIYPSEDMEEDSYDLFEMLGGQGTTPIVINSCVAVIPRKYQCIGTSVKGTHLEFQPEVDMPSRISPVMMNSMMGSIDNGDHVMYSNPFPFGTMPWDNNAPMSWPPLSQGSPGGLERDPVFWVCTFSKNNAPKKTIAWSPTDLRNHQLVWDTVKELILDDEGRTAFVLSGLNDSERRFSPIVKSGISSNATYTRQFDQPMRESFAENAKAIEVRNRVIQFADENAGVRWSENTLTIHKTTSDDLVNVTVDPENYNDYYDYLSNTVDDIEAGVPIVIHSCAVVEPEGLIRPNSKVPLQIDKLVGNQGLSCKFRINDNPTKEYLFEPSEMELGIFKIINEIGFLGKSLKLVNLETLDLSDVPSNVVNDMYFKLDEAGYSRNFYMVSGCSGTEHPSDRLHTMTNDSRGNPVQVNIGVLSDEEAPGRAKREVNTVTFIKNPKLGYTDFFDLVNDSDTDELTIYSSASIPCVILTEEGDSENPPPDPEIPDPDTETPELEPEDVTDSNELQDFDYALLRYRWKQEGGRDLDTRTYMQIPNRVDKMVGWAMRSSDERYLVWNNDNTGQGVESVLLDAKQMATDFSEESTISIALRAFWYDTKRSGNLSIEFATYKGGRMVASGYDWANVGGRAVQSLSINTHTPIHRSASKERGQHLATLEFNPQTNTGELIKITDFSGYAQGGDLGDGPSIDGPGSTLGPVSGSTAPGDTSGGVNGDYGDYDDVPVGTGPLPPIPSASEGSEFKITLAEEPTKVGIIIRDCVGEWALFDTGTIIAGTNYLTPGVTKDVWGNEIYLSIAPQQNVIKNFKLVAQATGAAISLGEYSTQADGCEVELFTYLPSAIGWSFNVKNATLKIPADLPRQFTTTQNMFAGSVNFDTDVSQWDMSNILNISGMFANCTNFNQDISGWDTSNVFDMSDLFRGCVLFNQDIGSWDVSNVGSMSSMFYGAFAFNQDLDRWDTSSLEQMSLIFGDTDVFNGNISTWDVSKVTSLNSVFSGAKAFNRDIGGWNTGNVTSMYETFKGAISFNQNINTWNVNKVTSMEGAFRGAIAFNQNINDWDVSNVTDMSNLFDGASAFNGKIDSWNTVNVTDMDYMFRETTAFNQDLSRWCVPTLSTPYDFNDKAYGWGLPKPVWGTCRRGENGDPVVPPNVIEPGFDFTMRSPNSSNPDFIILLTGVTGNWAMRSGNTLNYDQSMTNMSGLTINKTAKTVSIKVRAGLYAKTFRLSGEFTGIQISTDPSNNAGLSGSFIVHKFSPTVTNYKFALKLTKIELEDTIPAAVNTMRDMFKDSDMFDQDISDWNVSNVTNMRNAFEGCKKFNADLSDWDVSNVTDMVNAFAGCYTFNQDLSDWNVEKIKRKPIGFAPSNAVWVLPKPVWGTNAGVGDVPELPQHGETDTYIVNITNNDTLLTQPLEVINQVYQPGSVWSVKDLDTGVVIASNTAPTSTDPRIVCNKNSTFLTVTSTSPVSDTKRYGIKASGTEMKTICRPTVGSDVTMHGVLEIESFSNTIGSYGYTVSNVDFIAPNYLPTNIKTTKEMFRYVPAFNQDLQLWDTSNVTDMSSMFAYCNYFDGDVSTWDVSNVTNMNDMFRDNLRFNQNLNDWNVSNVLKFESMFSGCGLFNGNLSNWRPTSGTSFNNMFRDCVKFDQDISKWTMGTATDLSAMFYNCKVFNQDLSMWDTSNVTNMNYMFGSALKMVNQDLSVWCVSKIRNKPSDFLAYSNANIYNSPVWGTCPIKGMGFTIVSDDTPQSDSIFVLSAVGILPNWSLMCNGVLVANEEFSSEGVSVSIDGTDLQITLTGLRNQSLAYVLRANADSVTLGDGSYTDTRTITVNSFYNQIRRYEFRVGNDQLTVPNKLTPITVSLKNMFVDCTNFNQDVSEWVVGSVTDMSNVFKGCTSFNQDISGWDVRKVTDMSGMFEGCVEFNQDLSGWKHTRVSNMKNMFKDCDSFDYPLSTWVVNEVTDMSYMFYGCRKFDQDINRWNTAKVTDMSYMFYGCSAFNQVIDNWNLVRVTSTAHMFDGCVLFNQPVTYWNVENVLDMDYMFKDCISFNQPLDLWCVTTTTSKPTGFDMGASSWSNPKPVWGTCPLTGLIFSTESSTPDTELSFTIEMPYTPAAWELVDLLTGQTVATQDGARDEYPNVYVYQNEMTLGRAGQSTGRYMLKGKIEQVKLSLNGWFNDTVDYINVEQFSYTVERHQFNFNSIKHATVPTVLPRHVRSLQRMFYRCDGFNQDLSMWDTSNITDMSEMFYGTDYNQPIGSWNTGNVTTMNSMFRDNIVFNQDLSQWDTSSVMDMSRMFMSASEFNGNISTWDVSKVTGMSYFTYQAYKFNSDISQWDTGNVLQMGNMFASCRAFNQDISNWNVSRVTDFTWMFYDAQLFNQDLSGWCTPTHNKEPEYFSISAGAWVLPKPVWGTCPRLELQPPKPVIPQPVEEVVTQVPDIIESAVYKFSTKNIVNPGKRLPISINWGDSYRQFSLKENGVVIADYNAGVYGEGVSRDGYSLYIESKVGGHNNYELTTTNSSVRIRYNKVGDNPLAVEGEFIVEAFSSTVPSFGYDLACITLTVPEALPTTVTSLSDMFNGCTLFNQNINAWDTSRVTSLYSTFSRCISYNQPVSNWDTSNVTTMYQTFAGCSLFNQYLNNWNTSKVTSMGYMFRDASVFDADISNWDTSSVNSMLGMFQDATFFNQDISGWDTESVQNVSDMFFQAYYFNQDLSGWCVSLMENSYYHSGFASRAIAWKKGKPVWGTCPGKSTYFPFDISGNSGLYFTASKNGGDFITINLTDPDLNQADLLNLFLFGQSQDVVAFLPHPGALVEIENVSSSSILAVNKSGKFYPSEYPNGFKPTMIAITPEVILQAPFYFGDQVNTISIKATPNVPTDQDIFNSLDNPENKEVISFTSNSVIYLR